MKQAFEISTELALHKAFWEECPHLAALAHKGKGQNAHNAEVRTTWVDFVDSAQKSGRISERLANRATLKG